MKEVYITADSYVCVGWACGNQLLRHLSDRKGINMALCDTLTWSYLNMISSRNFLMESDGQTVLEYLLCVGFFRPAQFILSNYRISESNHFKLTIAFRIRLLWCSRRLIWKWNFVTHCDGRDLRCGNKMLRRILGTSEHELGLIKKNVC